MCCPGFDTPYFGDKGSLTCGEVEDCFFSLVSAIAYRYAYRDTTAGLTVTPCTSRLGNKTFCLLLRTQWHKRASFWFPPSSRSGDVPPLLMPMMVQKKPKFFTFLHFRANCWGRCTLNRAWTSQKKISKKKFFFRNFALSFACRRWFFSQKSF